MKTARDTGTAVLTADLSKSYGTAEVVRGLDLTVPAGEIFGFLGPNGAGKSTSLGMLSTLLRPTKGVASVAGYDVRHEQDEVRRSIGLVFQESTLDADLTAEQNLRFHADLYGLPSREGRRRTLAMLDLVGLTQRRSDRVRSFSGGMRRRLEVVRGLLHDPRVLFLDEPTTGLDPQTRAAIWEHLHQLREESGITIFLTTHHLEEAENCDRIAIMDRGRLVVEGAPAELKSVVGTDTLLLRTGDDEVAVKALKEHFALRGKAGPGGIRLQVADAAVFVPRLCAELTVPVHSVSVTPPTLDDVFLHYTGRAIRETGDGGPDAKGSP
ncbi:ATP-binding cassette domain-containing protein [Streptomyces sp. NPDC094034]|uniref:ATP-binding cassette domain-containing protein n=1 Tax=Streptomyces sp. NPDC094034 TaxID=3155309 RepID=UPI00331C3DED